jgi:hypothetical protein
MDSVIRVLSDDVGVTCLLFCPSWALDTSGCGPLLSAIKVTLPRNRNKRIQALPRQVIHSNNIAIESEYSKMRVIASR